MWKNMQKYVSICLFLLEYTSVCVCIYTCIVQKYHQLCKCMQCTCKRCMTYAEILELEYFCSIYGQTGWWKVLGLFHLFGPALSTRWIKPSNFILAGDRSLSFCRRQILVFALCTITIAPGQAWSRLTSQIQSHILFHGFVEVLQQVPNGQSWASILVSVSCCNFHLDPLLMSLFSIFSLVYLRRWFMILHNLSFWFHLVLELDFRMLLHELTAFFRLNFPPDYIMLDSPSQSWHMSLRVVYYGAHVFVVFSTIKRKAKASQKAGSQPVTMWSQEPLEN